MVQSLMLHFTCGGIWPLYCIGLNKKWKLQPMAPLKTFLPSWEEKGAIGKKKNKKITLFTHNIVEAHPHSKTLVCRCRPCLSIYKIEVLTKIPPKRDLPIWVEASPLYMGWPPYEAPNVLAWYSSILPFDHAIWLFQPGTYWCVLLLAV
jgi:hypothetical protein